MRLFNYRKTLQGALELLVQIIFILAQISNLIMLVFCVKNELNVGPQ